MSDLFTAGEIVIVIVPSCHHMTCNMVWHEMFPLYCSYIVNSTFESHEDSYKEAIVNAWRALRDPVQQEDRCLHDTLNVL